MGRTPIIGHVIREFLPRAEILNYLDAILRTYNRFGRRDNKWKARIKILVKERTPEQFARDVEEEWSHLQGGAATVPAEEFERLAGYFTAPAYEALPGDDSSCKAAIADNRAFGNWVKRNVHPHKVDGYADRHVVAETARRPARRRDIRPDGCDRRPGGPVFVSAKWASRTSRT